MAALVSKDSLRSKRKGKGRGGGGGDTMKKGREKRGNSSPVPPLLPSSGSRDCKIAKSKTSGKHKDSRMPNPSVHLCIKAVLDSVMVFLCNVHECNDC